LGTYFHEVANANAAVGTNIAIGEDFHGHGNRACRITALGLVGSAAQYDCQVSVYYGTRKIADLCNPKIGVVPIDDDIIYLSSRKYCKSNEKINVIVDVAPDTNPILLFISLAEVKPRRAA
jgi:hypothetical protein